MNKPPEAEKTISLVLVELFFAVAPILVLGFAAAATGESKEINKFLTGPEWPMTASILYGLTISRYIQGFMAAFKSSSFTNLMSEKILLLILLPTAGLVFSGVLIMASLDLPPLWVVLANYADIILAIITFIILGGNGIKNAD